MRLLSSYPAGPVFLFSWMISYRLLIRFSLGLLKVSGRCRCTGERRLPKYCMHYIRSSDSEARYQTDKLTEFVAPRCFGV